MSWYKQVGMAGKTAWKDTNVAERVRGNFLSRTIQIVESTSSVYKHSVEIDGDIWIAHFHRRIGKFTHLYRANNTDARIIPLIWSVSCHDELIELLAAISPELCDSAVEALTSYGCYFPENFHGVIKEVSEVISDQENWNINQIIDLDNGSVELKVSNTNYSLSTILPKETLAIHLV